MPNESKAELRRRLNAPAVVNPFPLADYEERKDAAVRQWIAGLFRYYEVDLAGENAWEHLAWRLAVDRFSGFQILAQSNIGAPRTEDRVDALLSLYESENPRLRYPKFLRAHKEECNALGLREPNSVKDAFYRARRRRAQARDTEQLLVHLETMKALNRI